MSEVNQVNTHGDDVAIYVEPKKRMPLVVIIMASLLGSLILGYGMSTAMVSVTTELNGAALAAWLFTAGNIVQMVMNPLLPSMNAKIPMPTLLLIGLLVGTATTAGIMLAQSMMVIIICRAIAGFSGAVIFAGGLAFAGQIMPPEKRPIVTGLQMAFNGIGSMAAPVIAGACVDAGNWRLWVGIALALFVIVTILYIIFYPRGVKTVAGEKADGVGVALLTILFVALAFLLQLSGTYWPWASPTTFALAVVCVVSLVLFVKVELKVERSGRRPAFRVTLFKVRPFLIATLCAMLACIVTNGVATYAPSYGQTVLGLSATQSALGYSVGSTLVIILSLFHGFFFGKKRWFKECNTISMLVFAVVSLLLIVTGTSLSFVAFTLLIALFAAVTAWGSSVNFVIGQVMVPTEDVLDSTAGITAMQTTGAFLGVALNSALINLTGYNGLFTVCVVCALACLVIMLFLKDPQKQAN